MSGLGKYLWAVIGAALLAHFAVIYATPRVLMSVAIERLGEGGFNSWRLAPRVTAESRAIVRPSPDFAYSACVYDLSAGPVRMHVAAWRDYWSLSLYDQNSDNFYTLNDRDLRGADGDIILVRNGGGDLEGAVHSPTRRGIALIRRLAPTPDAYARAHEVARSDLCAPFS